MVAAAIICLQQSAFAANQDRSNAIIMNDSGRSGGGGNSGVYLNPQ